MLLIEQKKLLSLTVGTAGPDPVYFSYWEFLRCLVAVKQFNGKLTDWKALGVRNLKKKKKLDTWREKLDTYCAINTHHSQSKNSLTHLIFLAHFYAPQDIISRVF